MEYETEAGAEGALKAMRDTGYEFNGHILTVEHFDSSQQERVNISIADVVD